jgi:predicted RNA-binding protein with PUA-like domain
MRNERNYWLFKSEPSVFSFEDLKNSPGGIANWDGVRNFQARNFLRDGIKAGDGVLFYHSNTPRPHVSGIAVVVSDGQPDLTALDPGSTYFDPRSTLQNPIWYMVAVRYCMPLARVITLGELKADPDFSGMVLLQRSRLSIQPVLWREWQLLLQLGGISAKDAELQMRPIYESMLTQQH